MTSDVNQSVYSDVGRLVAAPTPSLDFFRIATEAGLFAARNRNLLSGDQSSGTARPADTNSPFGQFNAQGNPTDIVDRDNRYHTQLGWQPVDSNNPNSPQEVASISDWRYQGSWTRQRDASGRLSDMWHGPNGQQWRGAISVLPDGTIRETHHSANGTTLDTRTYNPNTGTVIRQDAAGQVSVVAFPGNQVWTFERNAQGAVTARLNDQVMPGNYQFSPQGFTRTNPDGTVEQWNYDGTRTTRRRDGQGNQVIETTRPNGTQETQFPNAQAQDAPRRRTNFPANDAQGRVSQTVLVNGDVVTEFRDGRRETEFRSPRSDGMRRETTYPANDAQKRARLQVFANGTEVTTYQNRQDGLTVQTRYPANDAEHRTVSRSYSDGHKETEYNGRADGLRSETIFGPGDAQHRSRLQTYSDGRTVTTYSGRTDGMVSETSFAANDQQRRTSSQTFADGRVVTRLQNGTVETRRADGTIVREYNDAHFGRVTRTTHPSGSANEYTVQFNGNTVTVRRDGTAVWESAQGRRTGRVQMGADGWPYFHEQPRSQPPRREQVRPPGPVMQWRPQQGWQPYQGWQQHPGWRPPVRRPAGPGSACRT